jgi:hypothetical protein
MSLIILVNPKQAIQDASGGKAMVAMVAIESGRRRRRPK